MKSLALVYSVSFDSIMIHKKNSINGVAKSLSVYTKYNRSDEC